MFLEETPIKQVKRLAPPEADKCWQGEEGCPRAPRETWAEAPGTPCQMLSPSSLALASGQTPLMLVLVSRKKRWKKRQRQ